MARSGTDELGVARRRVSRGSPVDGDIGREVVSLGPELGPSVDLRRHHLDALDGLRAVAVAAVILYHLGLGWAGGGYLGVDVFFVLSGFLITGLLVEERRTSGTVGLLAFWTRRARRLLPALALMLGALSLYALAGGPGTNLQTLQRDLPATVFYVANWHFIAIQSSYFAQFVTPSPLEHTWSLAIEEQFYLGWPVLLLLVSRLRRWDWRRVAVAAVALLAIASAVDMARLAGGSTDLSRAYFGTDTRVFELMVGALLALWAESAHRSWTALTRWRGLPVLSGVSALGLVLGFGLLGGPPRWMFEGGFAVAAVTTALLMAGVTGEGGGPVRRILSMRAMCWVGTISYGLYLWHWPVVVLLTRASTGMPGWLVDPVRVALTLVLATASFYLVEQPARRRRLRGTGGLALAPVGVACVAVVVALATMAPTFSASAVEPPALAAAPTRVFTLAGTPSPDRPLRVIFIGDSVMESAAPALVAAFDSTTAVESRSFAFGGWGLTSDASWRKHLTNEISRYHPDVVVGTWSWDGAAALFHPAEYQILLDEAVRLVLTPGDGVRGVVFLQFPTVGHYSPLDSAVRGDVNLGTEAWNRIAAVEAAVHRHSVAYLPVGGALERDGRYSSWLPDARGRWVRVRTTDETHLCPAGAARYAAATLTTLSAAWHLPAPLSASWSKGWIRRPIYYRDAVCPDDAPHA